MRRKSPLAAHPYFPLWLFNALLLLFLVGAGVYLSLAARNPALFACVFARYTHLYCPGCGGSRAIYSLLRFDLVGSLLSNPAVLFGGVLTLYYEIAFFLSARGRARPRAWPIIAFAALVVLYFFTRNILLVAFGIDPLGDLIVFWS